jgi:hypothetical protein
MTLIASTLNHKMPFVLSDILWTYRPPKRGAVGPLQKILKQKMYIINETACVVFAGISPEIGKFLAEMKEHFKDKKVTHNRLHKFLHNYNLDKEFGKSAFFITYFQNLKYPKVFCHQFHCPKETNEVDRDNFSVSDSKWNIMADPIFDMVWACGSGSADFLEKVKERYSVESQFPEGHFMRATQTNTTLLSRVLTKEKRKEINGENDNQDWGVGFEAAYYDGKKFNKIDDIVYAISFGEYDDKGKVDDLRPVILMYYKYINDILYIIEIRLGNFNKIETETHIIYTFVPPEYRVTVYEVEGIDVNVDDYQLPASLSFTTENVAMNFVVPTKTGYINPAFFNPSPAVVVSYQQNKYVRVSVDKFIDGKIKGITERLFS